MRTIIRWLTAGLLISGAAGALPEQASIPTCRIYDLSLNCFPGKSVPDVGARAFVSNAASASDCTTGGGTTLNLCKFNGKAWVDDSDFASGGAATPAGSDTYVQFNDGGSALGGTADLAFNKSTKKLTVGGQIQGTSVLSSALGAGFILQPGGSGNTVAITAFSNPAANQTLYTDHITGTTGYLVEEGATQTLTNKTLGTGTVVANPGAAASDPVRFDQLTPATSFYKLDGSQNPTADQPMNGFTMTGTRNGVDGSTESANMVNVVAARGPSSLLGWPTFARQDCRDTDGVCPSPTGAIVIDPWIGWVKSPGQRRDDNSSMWSTVNGIGSQTADAATDFINQSNVFTITGAGGSQYATTVDLAGNTNGPDKYFCRCSTSPFAPADTDGTCTTNGGGTSTVQPTSSHYEAIVFKHGSRYYFASVTAYNGCNANPSTITLGSRLPVAISTGDSFQYAMPDGIHPDTYYYRWLAQNILEARWEATYWPKVNLLGNDEIKNGVTQNALGESCTNWTKNSGSAGTVSTGSFPAAPAGGGFLNAVRGSSCYLSAARAAGDSIRTPAATVEPGKVYAFHGWVRMNSGNGGDTNTVRVRPFNASGDTILGSTEFKTFWINGYDAPPVQWSSTGDSGHEVCAEWCFVVVLVKPATATSIYIDINGQTSTANLMGDEWVGFPSMYEQLDLHYVFPDAGNQSWWVHTDSRGLDANAYGDGSGNKERINKALDTMQPIVRPLMTFSQTMAVRNTSNSGHSLATDIALAGFSANRPQFGLIHLGVNDAGNYSSANMVTAVQNTVKDGTIPVLILEGAYRGDTTDTTACGGTNCTGVFMTQEKTFLQQGNAN